MPCSHSLAVESDAVLDYTARIGILDWYQVSRLNTAKNLILISSGRDCMKDDVGKSPSDSDTKLLLYSLH